jgi:hypothetical protein
MTSEKHPLVWGQIMAQLTAVGDAWKYETKGIRDSLDEFMRNVFAPEAKSIGWEFAEGEDLLLSQHKTGMFRTSGLIGDPT